MWSTNIIRIVFASILIKSSLAYNDISHISEESNANALSNAIQSSKDEQLTTENDYTTISTPNKSSQIEYTINSEAPSDCSQREKLKTQPVNDNNSYLKKCCPMGESFVNIENQSSELCADSIIQYELKTNVITAILYDNCIEDIESEPLINIEISNPCNTSILYNNEEDMFYILQDGSLLLMDEYANDSYNLERSYCLDVDMSSGRTYAVVCITSVAEYLKRGQIVTVAIFTLISIPCLLLIAYLHLAVKELRTVHGISLSLLSLSLAIGYLIHSLVHIFNSNETSLFGYAVQFFILSYYFWYLCICINVFLNIWFVIVKNKTVNNFLKYSTLAVYCLISFLGPLIFVLLSLRKGLPGMPSYFIQGTTESIRDSQRYFIPPVSTVLFLCFTLMTGSFFGFQKVKKRLMIAEEKNLNTLFDATRHEEVKKDAKCISFLGVIMIVAWFLEIITFYTPGPESYLILLEILNGLQGLFIMLIFLIVRKRRSVIIRWWMDRGTHIIDNSTELHPINT